MNKTTYDIGIIGGGLAGLSLAIQAAKKGYNVVLYEKERYPFHKVCGEYISLESWPFLESLGLPLQHLALPIINELVVSSPNGKFLQQHLPQGGFGISRYKLDNLLKNIAIENGVVVLENVKVEDVLFEQDMFTILAKDVNTTCSICCGSFGKRSNLDSKWKRNFTVQKANPLNNYVGVKYHAKLNFPNNQIALHNFKNGYCGISKIEDDLYCICYLTTAANVKKYNGDILKMQQNILQQNPFLQHIFTTAFFEYAKPLTIAQISFSQKTQVQNHILCIGDAAGMITPLCGNGMSMALHGSKIAFEQIDLFLANKINRKQMETSYTFNWQNQFGQRLKVGRIIQQFFGKKWLTNFFVAVVNKNKWLATKLIKLTHGKPF
jgi:menaquinone-9 beta-reductase